MKKVILTALLAVTTNSKGHGLLKPRRDSYRSPTLEITYAQARLQVDAPKTSEVLEQLRHTCPRTMSLSLAQVGSPKQNIESTLERPISYSQFSCLQLALYKGYCSNSLGSLPR